MTTHPPAGPVTGGSGSGGAGSGPTKLVDFLLDAFVVIFKAIPRGARR